MWSSLSHSSSPIPALTTGIAPQTNMGPCSSPSRPFSHKRTQREGDTEATHRRAVACALQA